MLDTFLAQAWRDHAEQPAAVAARLPEGLPLAQDDDGVVRFAALAHHVLGEHLGQWPAGLDVLAQLEAQGVHGAAGTAALARCRASLKLCAGEVDERAALSPSDQCRATAMAAANLAVAETARAADLLQEAKLLGIQLPDADPGVRAVAANAHSIAATLQETTPLTATQRALMLRAAQISRSQWARAGTWLEVERAEYRLAVCHLAAGDPAQALEHAHLCDGIVRENGSQPLEVFFAAEALGLPARALNDRESHAAAVAMARKAFAELPPDDQGWCRATLDKLDTY